MYEVSISFDYLRSAYECFFFSFLSPNDQRKYKHRMTKIYVNHHVTKKNQARVAELQESLVAKYKGGTDKGKARKDRITNKLFKASKKITLHLPCIKAC